MERKAASFDASSLAFKTMMAKRRVTDFIKLAAKVDGDVDHDIRLARQLCKACFYFPRMAGQAFTSQDCACCHEPQTYSSTDTDALCKSCAKNHDLCKHCSADLSLRERRKTWPAAQPTTKE